MRVGFIGLGTMGSGISANIRKAGHEMVVHDARRQAAEKICAAGAEWADSPKAVAEATEVVFTSLPGPREFEAVVRGDNGLLAGMQRGQPLFDLSTNSPTLMRSLEPLFTERGAVLFDSPVSGGPAGAASGKMAIWVGGDEAVFKRYRPVLDSAGDQVSYIGPIGSASVAKLVHNLSGYMIQTALAEAYRVLKIGGRFVCLEFSAVTMPGLDKIYDLYSFNVIPALGRAVVVDAESYRYLVESIRNFPKPQAFADMMRAAGFARVSHRLMSGGIVALHSGWRL